MSTILLVDDSADLRELMAAVLTADGHEVIEAANGQEAYDLLRVGHQPALILLDLMMPVLSGAELIELLQSDGKLALLPVVIISAFADDGPAVVGVKRFVCKPVTAKTLREIVAEFAVAR